MATSDHQMCSHPETHLTEIDNLDPTNCGACECLIAGKIYHCSACNSNLHPFCKNLPPTLSSRLHPIPGHPLSLLVSNLVISCDCKICDEPIKGAFYTCPFCEFDVHPQCSRLPLRVPCPYTTGNPHFLRLQITGDLDHCKVCGNECAKWSYRCDVCTDVSVHFLCLADSAEGSPEPEYCQSRGFLGFHRRNNNNSNSSSNNNNNNNNNNNSNYNNNDYGGRRPGGGFGRFMGRMTGSVAAGVISDFFGNMMDDGDLF